LAVVIPRFIASIFARFQTSSSILIEVTRVYYNFTKKHGGLNGDTPADRSGILIQGNNKWLTIIQNASKKQKKIMDF